jgi:hypothetical protein
MYILNHLAAELEKILVHLTWDAPVGILSL